MESSTKGSAQQVAGRVMNWPAAVANSTNPDNLVYQDDEVVSRMGVGDWKEFGALPNDRYPK